MSLVPAQGNARPREWMAGASVPSSFSRPWGNVYTDPSFFCEM